MPTVTLAVTGVESTTVPLAVTVKVTAPVVPVAGVKVTDGADSVPDFTAVPPTGVETTQSLKLPLIVKGITTAVPAVVVLSAMGSITGLKLTDTVSFSESPPGPVAKILKLPDAAVRLFGVNVTEGDACTWDTAVVPLLGSDAVRLVQVPVMLKGIVIGAVILVTWVEIAAITGLP